MKATVKKVKSGVRREQIVQAAITIIGRKGVNGVTTLALGREAGISEANLYRHFKNKDDIYFAVVDHVRAKVLGNLEKSFSGPDHLAMLRRFFSLQTELLAGNSGIHRLMFSEDLHIHHSLRERILETIHSVAGKLADLIKAAQKEGSVRGDIDPGTTAMMFISMVQGLAFRWSLEGFSFSVASEGAKTWKHFEKFIAAGKGKQSEVC